MTFQARLGQPQATLPQPAEAPGGVERRSTDPLNQLGRQWDRVCRQAVAPGEIMVALEAAGLNDAIARERYGCADLLDCAERLYQLVPYRPASDSPPAPGLRELWPTFWPPLLRSLTYLLPAAWLPVTPHLWPLDGAAGGGAALGWAVATLFCWGWGQLAAFLGYHALGRREGRQAAGLARALTGLGLGLLVPLSLLAALTLGRPLVPTVVVALATALYIFSAYTLLMYRREALLFALGLPAAALGLALTGELGGTDLHRWAPGLLALAVLPPAALAAFLTREAGWGWPERPGDHLLRPALGHAVYGWSCAAFLSWATVTGARVAPLEGLAGSLVLVPLVLSMGALEWLVERLVTELRAEAANARTGHLEGLIVAAGKALAWRVGWYVLVLAGLHLLLADLGRLELSAVHLVGQMLFGVAVLVSAVLIALQRLRLVVVAWLISLALLVVLSVLPSGAFLSPSGVFLFDIEALLFFLLLFTAVTLHDVTSYQ